MERRDIQDELHHAIYGSRMLVMLETPDGFVQLVFTADQLKKVSETVASCFPLISKDGPHEVLDLKISEQTLPTDLFIGMSDYDDEVEGG